MSLEQNKAVVRRFFDEFCNEQRFEIGDEILSDDYVNYAMGQPLPKDAAFSMAESIYAAFPDLHVTILEEIAEGDSVATRHVVRGTHRGEFQGVAPTGRTVEAEGVSIHRVRDGKIYEDYPGASLLLVLLQVGINPLAAPAGA